MAPLEQIEQGILKGDLQLVAMGYAALTGKEIRVLPSKQASTPKRRGRPPKNPPLEVVDDIAGEDEVVVAHVNKEDVVLERIHEIRKSRGFDTDQFRVPVKDGRPVRTAIDDEAKGDDDDSSEAGKAAVALPWEPPKGNKFKDDKKIAKGDIKIDKKLTAKVKPSARRPPVREEKKVKVECVKCNRKYEVPASEANRSNGEESMSNVCLSCMSKVIRR
jgi:hypothetical protein